MGQEWMGFLGQTTWMEKAAKDAAALYGWKSTGLSEGLGYQQRGNWEVNQENHLWQTEV